MKTTESTTKNGARLVDVLKAACKAVGKPIAHLAQPLGISISYWQSICSGAKSIQPLMKDKQARDAAAAFLAVPAIEVMALADMVESEDFVIDQSIDDQLNSVYLQMRADALWSSLVPQPAAWDSADRTMKLLVSMMYQSALRDSMLSKVNLTSEGDARFVRFEAREGLVPALDQLGKWGQAPRQAA